MINVLISNLQTPKEAVLNEFTILDLAAELAINVPEGGILSRTVLKSPAVNVILFQFAPGEERQPNHS